MTNKITGNTTPKDIDSLALLIQLWEGRKTIVLSAAIFACIAFFAMKVTNPIYRLTTILEQQTSQKINQSINNINFLLQSSNVGQHSLIDPQNLSLLIFTKELGQILVNDESDTARPLDLSLTVEKHLDLAIKVKIETSAPDDSENLLRTLFQETNLRIASHLVDTINYELDFLKFKQSSALKLLENRLSASVNTEPLYEHQGEQLAEIEKSTGQQATRDNAESSAANDGDRTGSTTNRRSLLTEPPLLLNFQSSRQALRSKILELENSPLVALLEAEVRTLKTELENFAPYVLPEQIKLVRVRQDKELILMIGLFGAFIGALVTILKNSLSERAPIVG